LIFAVVLAKVIGNRVRLFILLGLWIAAGIILTQVANNAGLAFPGTENLALWQTLAITFGIIYVLVFAFGWLRSKRYKIREEMKTWTWSVALMIVLGLISIPLQSVEFSTVWPPMVIPIGVAIWGVIGSLILGAILGLNAGYKGGWWDQSIMQGLDALIAFPVIVLYLVIIASVEQQTDMIIILAVTITGAPGVARLVRSLTLDIKTRDYIQAAETRGESANYIMFREIMPNARGPILVDSMLRVGYAIFAIGTLGFLGLGLPPPDPDWGTMVADARQFIFAYPVGVVWPAIAIASLVIGLNLFADGMREELTRYQK
jgi:ABC-type dipeptide/oligopeptide/nickel transport system permease subunit